MKPSYLLGAVINVATLCIGLTVGFMFGTAKTQSVYAQQQQAEAQQQQAQASPQFEEITPVIFAGSAAFNTLLTHRIATDELTINGYNILVMQQNLLNLLHAKHIATFSELDGVVERSMVSRPLRLKMPPQQQPQSTTPKPPQGGKPK